MTKQQLEDEAAEIAALVEPDDGESLVDAVRRNLLQGAKDASGAHITAGAGSIPAPATISADNPASVPDDDPNDPRPEMHPALGWRTQAVLDWAARQFRARYSNLN